MQTNMKIPAKKLSTTEKGGVRKVNGQQIRRVRESLLSSSRDLEIFENARIGD